MRYFLEISYIGTNFHGWQRQNNANSIQAEIEDALSLVFNTQIIIKGSSRTDAGVHAKQQFAHFDTEIEIIEPSNYIRRLNKILDDGIAIVNFGLSKPEFHARYDAKSRKYIYRICKYKNPFISKICACYSQELNIDLLNEVSALLLNHSNFESFSRVKTKVNNFNCAIEYAFWFQNGEILEFHIKANRFLRGMVRAIVGTILEVGKGKMSFEKFEEIILLKSRNAAGNAAKPEGLTLEEVNYEGLIM